jgi:hypothetical protein
MEGFEGEGSWRLEREGVKRKNIYTNNSSRDAIPLKHGEGEI